MFWQLTEPFGQSQLLRASWSINHQVEASGRLPMHGHGVSEMEAGRVFIYGAEIN
jgi:hypothetical protein